MAMVTQGLYGMQMVPRLLALLFLLGAAVAATAEELPRYSLVVAVAESTVPGEQPVPCPELAICADTISFGAFAKAVTLAGREMPEAFGAQLVTHTMMRGQPLLMLLEHHEDGRLFAISWNRGPSQGGMACLDASSFSAIGWRAEGDGITRDGDRICAEVPSGGYREMPEPVVVVQADDIGQVLGKRRKRGLSKPDDSWGDIYLVLLDLGQGKAAPGRVFFPEGCDAPEMICLGSSIMVHRIEGAEVIAASTDKRFGIMPKVIHKPGPHAARGAEGGRFIALAERTDDGYWWVPWYDSVEQNKACVARSVIEQFDVSLGARSIDDQGDEVCFRI